MSFENDFDYYVMSPNIGGSGGAIVAVCIHDEEYPEREGSDREVAAFLAKPSVGASVTGCHSASSSTGCVKYGTAAWHSGAGSPWNKMIEGYEHDGYAHQTRSEWLDPYGIRLFERSAKHTAKRCGVLGIPVRWLTPDQLAHAIRTGNPADGGICDHYCITLAAKVKGGHYDCGPHFPSDYYIERVLAHYNGNPGDIPAPQVPDPVVTTTNSGRAPIWSGFSEQTKLVQQYLSELGISPGPVDGVYGSQTENAVIQFQKMALDTDGNRLDVDGICGPKTFTSLKICVYLKRVGDATPPPEVISDMPKLPYTVALGRTRDPVVKKIQLRLRDRGWLISVDGDFGPETDSVVRNFQAEKGLDIDGIVGENTWREIFRTDNVT